MSISNDDSASRANRGGFGYQPRAAKKKPKVSALAQRSPSDDKLIADFIAKNGITQCPSSGRYAEGAIKASGEYEF